MASVLQMKQLVDFQQDLLIRLDSILANAKKLAVEKRTQEAMVRTWNQAKGILKSFDENHRVLVENRQYVDDSYLTDHYPKTAKVMKNLNNFILHAQPGCIEIWPPDSPISSTTTTSSEMQSATTLTTAATTSATSTIVSSQVQRPSLPNLTLPPVGFASTSNFEPMTPVMVPYADARDDDFPFADARDDEFDSTRQENTLTGLGQQNDFFNQAQQSAPLLNVDQVQVQVNQQPTMSTMIAPRVRFSLPSLSSSQPQTINHGSQPQMAPQYAQPTLMYLQPNGGYLTVPPPGGVAGGSIVPPPPHSQHAMPNDAQNGSTPEWFQLAQMLTQNQHQQTQQLIASLARPSSESRSSSNGFRLPELTLPKFNGDCREFKVFQNMLTSMMERTQFRPIEKLQILRNQLSGPAARAIEHLALSDENYEIAWQNLTRMFDNESLQIAANIDNVLNCKRPERNRTDSLLNHVQSWSSSWNNLKGMNVTAEDIFVHLVMQSLDSETKGRLVEKRGDDSSMPSLEFLMKFEETEHRMLLKQQIGNKSSNKVSPQQQPPKKAETTKALATAQAEERRPSKCFICSESHTVLECPRFLAAPDRVSLLRDFKLCIFCVKHRFVYTSPCKKKKYLKCEICSEQHIKEVCQAAPGAAPKVEVTQAHHCNHVASVQAPAQVLLPSAVASIEGNRQTLSIRCLIDQGSQKCYVTENVVQKLRLKKTRVNVKVLAVNGAVAAKITGAVVLTIKTKDTTCPTLTIPAFVMPNICGDMPDTRCELKWAPEDFLELADPLFYEPAHVGILLGSDIIPDIMREGLKRRDGFLLQNTVFGWIVSGRSNSYQESRSSFDTNVVVSFMSLHAESDVDEESFATQEIEHESESLDRRVERFWDLPIEPDQVYEDDVDFCEKLFREHHSRTPDGRYICPIPWRLEGPVLGPSYRQAVKSFLAQEWRWEKDEIHKKLSDDFMSEYIKLGHMSLIPQGQQQIESGDVSYIPYLSVIRKDALTTKFRTVFNASSPTSNGFTVNDAIHPGPKLQTHIPELLIAVRQFQFMYTSDVTKMFRQVLVPEADRMRLRILWRPSKSEKIQEYGLNTITYGLDAAPWMSLRVLHQAAEDNSPDDETKEIIQRHFYVDDLIYGADTIVQAQEQIEKIIATLDAAKLPLTKWASNNDEVLANIDDSKKITAYKEMSEEDDPSIKLLGMNFHPKSDEFSFNIKVPEQVKYTKRGMLSIAAGIFDPCCLLLPVLMLFRILIQGLWLDKYGWDDPIDTTTQLKFKKIIDTLGSLNSIRFPRWSGACQSSEIDLIGLSDSSMNAFAAVIYTRIKVSFAGTTDIIVRLLCAKGRVTPLKTKKNLDTSRFTIPKMELASIELLCQMFNNVIKQFKQKIVRFSAYSDSEICIAWIRSDKQIEDKFVRNKVATIRKTLSPSQIHHVISSENSADPASRGLVPEKLLACDRWLSGPSWIKDEILPETSFNSSLCFATSHVNVEENFTLLFSSWMVMFRTIARLLRWKSKATGPFSSEEIANAKRRIIGYQQMQSLGMEIGKLRKGLTVPVKHWLSPLMPFLDEFGILRVGGRLSRAADLTENQKHPIILPKSHLADLIVEYTHLLYMHAGNSLTARFLRDEYFIPAILQRIKKVIRRCVVCIRFRTRTYQQPMDDLPAARVSMAPAFSHVGTDLCGAFLIRASKTKYDRKIKVYIASFICFTTKCVHLEIVDDLSTECFMDAFNRFSSRRGKPTTMYSDNGSNFRAASKQLQAAWESLLQSCTELFAVQEIKWKFTAPLTPAQGGFWEASIRSLKSFVNKAGNIGNLTYPDFSTLLCKIEGILNSRPLYPNSLDACDASAITPFQLVTLRDFKLSSLDALLPCKVPATKRLLWAQDLLVSFWETFQKAYYATLTKRWRWRTIPREIKIDDVCIITEPGLKPGEWKLGRITRLYPNDQNIVRRVDLKTAKRETVHRAVNNLIPLLTEEEEKLEPPIRSSRRNKSTALMTCALLCWYAFMPTATGLMIESLKPGIHIKPLGYAQLKEFDFDFTVVTNVNVTHDLLLIDSTITALISFCNGFDHNKYPDLINYCQGMSEKLKQEANDTRRDIMMGYQQHQAIQAHSRKTRAIPIAAAALGSLAVKYGPHLMFATMSATVAYQTYKNYDFEAKIDSLKATIVSVTKLLSEKTDLEYEAVEHELGELYNHQLSSDIKVEITSYIESLRMVYSDMRLRHKNLADIRPLKQLEAAIAKPNKKKRRYRLPLSPSVDLFSINPSVKRIMNDMAQVSFSLPLVGMDNFSEYIVISVPDVKEEAIVLNNNKLVLHMIIDDSNSTMFDVEHADQVLPNVFANAQSLQVDDCMRSLMRSPNLDSPDSCSKSATTSSEILLARETVAVIFSREKSDVRVSCPDEKDGDDQLIHQKVVWIDFTNCTLTFNEIKISAMKIASTFKEEERDFQLNTIPNEEIRPFTRNPRIAELNLEIDEAISFRDWPNQHWFVPAVAGVIACVMLLVTSLMIQRKCAARWNRDETTLDRLDRIPQTWTKHWDVDRLPG